MQCGPRLGDRGAQPLPLAAVGIPGLLVVDRGLLAQRYDARPGTVYLIRPDQHVAARWRHFDAAAATAALQRCLGGTAEGARA